MICIHTYIFRHYNPSVRIIDIVSRTTYVVCVNFIHKWRDLLFKVDSERENFLRNFSWQFYFYSQSFCQKSTYLLYLIGHNNPINGFRPAATLPSRRFCSLRAYASWLHQSMTGHPRFDLSNGCKVVLFADIRRSPHQIPVSPEHPPPYERHGRASAAAGY